MEFIPMHIFRTTSRIRWRLCVAIGAALVMTWNVSGPRQVDAQGLIKGVEQGAREGNKAAGPVGGVLGGAIGGVVGVVTGVTGTFAPANNNGANNNASNNDNSVQPGRQASDPNEAKKQKGAKASKATKLAKAPVPAPAPAMLTQQGVPVLTAEQIVTNSDANIERIKKELNLTAEQEKNWGPFASAMHYLGHNGADRLNLRIARAKRDPPDDIIEQMRNEAQFLVDRAADQRNVADSADPLFATLDDKQKQLFIDEMVRLSHERGLD
jgi:LTXXQ motif family protein